VKPDTSYGYIQFREPKTPVDKMDVDKLISSTEEQPRQPINLSTYQPINNLYEVVTFTEKPPVEMARQMIASGEFFWNTGLLVWRLPVLRKAYEQFLPAMADSFFNLTLNTNHTTLEQVYSQCEAISVDHGIMEKADNVHVLAASFGWSDVETWDSLYSVFNHDKDGNALGHGMVVTNDTRNCMVAVPSDITVVLDGLDGYIIAAGNDTLMICRRQNEDKIFKFANDVEMQQLLYSKVK
jgi:mannose-1-phosphate guanylyltransferase